MTSKPSAPDRPMADRLERFLADVEPGRTAIVESYEPITGGYSRIIGKAMLRWSDGTRQTVVVRGDPEKETVFRSQRDAEWRLLLALAEVEEVATPRPLWYDATGEHFGSRCIVTDFSDGENLQQLIQDGVDLAARAAMFADVVAAIHRVPMDVLPEEMQFTGPWDAYIDGVIDRYEKAEAGLSTSNPVFRYVGWFLRTHRPPPVPLTLVHGDPQPGNVLVAEGARPVVIDWEFGHVGDPREDLGYYAQIPMPPNLYLRDQETYLAQYRQATGLSEEEVNPRTVDYFRMIGMAPLLIQMAEGVDALSVGRGGGVLANYLVNAVSFQCAEYLDACRRLT